MGYSTRGELLKAGVTQSNPTAAFRSADGFLYSTTQICGTNRYSGELCAYPTQAFDPRNGAILSTQYFNGVTSLPMTRWFSYDTAGRRAGQEYDALNRLLLLGSSTAGTGYAYGPGTIPVGRGSYTNHASMGSTPIYTTDSSSNVLDVKLGMNDDILPTNTAFNGLTVYDRDPFGFIAAARNNGGSSAWNIPDMFSTCGSWMQVGAATSGFVSTPMTDCAPAGKLHAYRTDGYFDGSLTFRGVRTYQGDTQQWSTPDMYQGQMGDPMSAMGYNYAGNNPAMFADPSGFCDHGWTIDANGNTIAAPDDGWCPSPQDPTMDLCVIGCFGPSANPLGPPIHPRPGFGKCKTDPGGGLVCTDANGKWNQKPRVMNARADCFFEGGFRELGVGLGLTAAGGAAYGLRSGGPGLARGMRSAFGEAGPYVLGVSFLYGGIKGYAQGQSGGICH